MATLVLPYKTLRQCQKAYKENAKSCFSFSGYDTEKEKDIKACASVIYCEKFRNASESKLATETKGNKEIEGFFKNMKEGNREKAMQLLFS